MGSTPAAERRWRVPTVTRGDLPGLALAVAVCEAVGVLPALVTATRSGAWPWPATLARPSFAPPDWVFATAWTALFALLGVAVFLVVRDGRGRLRLVAVGLFVGQFALNVAWMLLFFGGGSTVVGLVVAVALLWSVVATTAAFCEIRLAAAALLAPYLTWVCFAAHLNYALLALQ